MRFRFSLRDLIWLTAVVALAVGWWIDRATFAGAEIEIRHLQKALEIAKADKEIMSRAYDRLSAQSAP